MAEDEELAAAYRPGEIVPKVRISTWSPEVELLAASVDRLGHVFAALVALGGGSPPKVDPVPRPETAFQRRETTHIFTRHESLVDRLIPK